MAKLGCYPEYFWMTISFLRSGYLGWGKNELFKNSFPKSHPKEYIWHGIFFFFFNCWSLKWWLCLQPCWRLQTQGCDRMRSGQMKLSYCDSISFTQVCVYKAVISKCALSVLLYLLPVCADLHWCPWKDTDRVMFGMAVVKDIIFLTKISPSLYCYF